MLKYFLDNNQISPKQSEFKISDDTSLLSTVQDITTNTVSLNNDLTNIPELAVHWKIKFNPDPSKQAQELLFSRKTRFKP